MMIEMNAGMVEEHGSIPEQGDFIAVNDAERLVVSVTVINNAKVVLKTTPRRGRNIVDDPMDPSVEWPELPEPVYD